MTNSQHCGLASCSDLCSFPAHRGREFLSKPVPFPSCARCGSCRQQGEAARPQSRAAASCHKFGISFCSASYQLAKLGHSQEIDRRLEKKLKITQKERKSKSPPKVPIVIQDDSLPAGPPPQIRILKRPTSNGVLSSPHSASRPAFPVKSLAQREAEYAEARKRILGSASPEEEQEKPILDRPPRISQPEDSRQPNNVIRQPLGPDGSQGFKQRR
ncbi:SUZ domain-containing protein 1 isoform X4 [Haemorhous mexicanus]|uniref:SUZ domain-containing protein 1 isoform X4 n=1 Tax=Haemorhous mexicanus TaxID=30427 RepID=UPI0028BE0DDE|nr:SUZ domain-containing protein 1 isoform X4 [Haemorhous mexicanus]